MLRCHKREFPTTPNSFCMVQDIDDDFVDKQVVDEGNGDGGEETHPSGASKHEHSLTRVPDSRIRKIVSGRQAAAKRWKKVRTIRRCSVQVHVYFVCNFTTRQTGTNKRDCLVMPPTILQALGLIMLELAHRSLPLAGALRYYLSLVTDAFIHHAHTA